MKKLNGFTLSETLIVIVVLGIIATLTIPALVNKNKESVAKTKVRKAMAAYESALNKMIIENDLKSDTALNEWAGATANCGNPSNYFKKVQGDGCIFKTSDGIWWNISDIERPVISFKEINAGNSEQITANANNLNDKTAFVLVGRFDNNGSLRVDDLAYETANSVDDANGYASKAQVEKLYNLLGLKSPGAGGGNEPQSIFSSCDPTQLTCTIDGIEYTKKIIEEDQIRTYCTYDDDWNEISCENESTVTSGTYWTRNFGANISWNDAQATCAQGTHLPTIGELEFLFESNDLKCQDGSTSCGFWAAEDNLAYGGCSFYAFGGYDCNLSKNVGDRYVQVLCVGK